MRALAAAALLLLGATPAPRVCRMAAPDEAWIDRAIANWRTAERRLLRLAPQPLPAIYAVDARCTYRLTGRRWTGKPHGGAIEFPGGNKSALGPISFATADAGGYFAMSLPSVWRAAGVTSGLGLERLMDGVMLHEFMHARQFYFVTPRLKALGQQYGFGDAISDDSLQERWEKVPAYVGAYAKERDTLFAAAAAPEEATARRLAGEALAMMRARHARWFTGAEAKWAPLDDVFLQMEGVGQWLFYAWTAAPFGGRVPAAMALEETRRGDRQWSQAEGLALFLVVDRLVSDWQHDAFVPEPLLAEALLAKAASGSSPRVR